MNHLQISNVLWNLKRILDKPEQDAKITIILATMAVDNALELLRMERDQYLLADRPDPRERDGEVLWA